MAKSATRQRVRMMVSLGLRGRDMLVGGFGGRRGGVLDLNAESVL